MKKITNLVKIKIKNYKFVSFISKGRVKISHLEFHCLKIGRSGYWMLGKGVASLFFYL